jgi:hypothetical protein
MQCLGPRRVHALALACSHDDVWSEGADAFVANTVIGEPARGGSGRSSYDPSTVRP